MSELRPAHAVLVESVSKAADELLGFEVQLVCAELPEMSYATRLSRGTIEIERQRHFHLGSFHASLAALEIAAIPDDELELVVDNLKVISLKYRHERLFEAIRCLLVRKITAALDT